MISSILFVVTNISLVVDFFIYRIYGFHINAMVLNIILSPDAADSIQLGIAPIATFVAIVSFFIVYEIFIYKKIVELCDDVVTNINRFWNKILIIPIFLIIVTEKFIYGWNDLENNSEIISKFRVIPLYQPLTFTKFAKKYFGYIPKAKVSNEIDMEAAIRYPLKNLEFAKKEPINIFIFAADAVRNSEITPEVAPNIFQFKQEAYHFENHRSGGNATRFGIFSLLYGLHSTYWFNFLNAHRGSILFDVLKKLDYEIHIISSTNTNWPEFKKTAYVNVQSSIVDQFDGSPWEKDKRSSAYFIDMIQKRTNDKYIFSFVFLDAPHGYSFPPSENLFQADRRVNYLTVSKDSKDVPAIYAGYKNAIHYDDKLFGKMVDALKAKGLYENSIVVFTSDHGEEFYEYGSFGHNNNFSKAQTGSPLIVKLPKGFEVELPQGYPDNLTSHADLVPTLLHFLSVLNNPDDYANGKNLFDKNYKRKYAFCANWNHNAIITSQMTYVFSNLPNKMFDLEVYDTQTYKKIFNHKPPAKLIVDVMEQNSKFLKK